MSIHNNYLLIIVIGVLDILLMIFVSHEILFINLSSSFNKHFHEITINFKKLTACTHHAIKGL